MYSWYMPKDETLTGLGHRHDWEACVVWVDDIAASSPKIVALSASAHSGYNKYYPPSSSYFSGNSAKIDYSSSYVVINHALSATSTAGETQPLDHVGPAHGRGPQGTGGHGLWRRQRAV